MSNEKEVVVAVRAATTELTIRNNQTKESNVMNTNRADLRTQALPSYLTPVKAVVVPEIKAAKAMAKKPKSFGILTVENAISSKGGQYVKVRLSDEILTLPASIVSQSLEAEIDEVAPIAGRAFTLSQITNDYVNRVEWAQKPHMNNLSLSIILAMREGRQTDIRRLVTKCADYKESFVEQFDSLSLLLQAAGCDFTLHAFHLPYTGDHVIDNSDEEFESAEFTQDEDEAAQFIRGMEQTDLRVETGKSKASQAMGDYSVEDITPHVTKEEWIEYMVARPLSDWEADAGYGVWARLRKAMEFALEDKVWTEWLGRYKEKPLAFFKKTHRRYFDALAKIASNDRRREYLQGLSAADDADLTSSTSAINGAKRDEDILELDTQDKELNLLVARMEPWLEDIRRYIDLARIKEQPVELEAYTGYTFFDPIEEIVAQVATKYKIAGKRFGYPERKAATSAAAKSLFNPTITMLDGITNDKNKPMKIWQVSWDVITPTPREIKEEARPNDAATIRHIRALNMVRYAYSQRTGDGSARDGEMAKIYKSMRTQNKKRMDMAALADEFIF